MLCLLGDGLGWSTPPIKEPHIPACSSRLKLVPWLVSETLAGGSSTNACMEQTWSALLG